MIRRPPRSTRTDTLFPYTTLFRSRPKYFPAKPRLLNCIHWIALVPSAPGEEGPVGRHWTFSPARPAGNLAFRPVVVGVTHRSYRPSEAEHIRPSLGQRPLVLCPATYWQSHTAKSPNKAQCRSTTWFVTG